MDGVAAEFELRNCLAKVVPDSEDASLEAYAEYLRAASLASDEGELVVKVPDTVRQRLQGGPPPSLNQAQDDVDDRALDPVVVRVWYTLVRPKGGLRFVGTTPEFPYRPNQCYTVNMPGSARMWFPCLDSETERSTFELEVTTDLDSIAVASGELVEQVLSADGLRRTFRYSLDQTSTASSIGLAVGPWEVLPDETRPQTTHFCPPGRSDELAYVSGFLHNVFDFYKEYLGFPFPYASYKQVFVDEAYSPMVTATGMTIFSTHLLHDESIIDQTWETRRLLAQGVAAQYFGTYINVKANSELWIALGLAAYLASLYFRKSFGYNEYRLRCAKLMEAVTSSDFQGPLSWDFPFQAGAAHHPEFGRRAEMVVFLLDRKLGSDAFRKAVSSLLAPSAKSQTIERNLSRKRFLKLLKRNGGLDCKSFVERWADGRGYINVTCGFLFSKKKHHVEFALKQERFKAQGAMQVRVQELDGPFDHPVTFDDDSHQFEFPCHSRVQRVRKKRKSRFTEVDDVKPDNPEGTPEKRGRKKKKKEEDPEDAAEEEAQQRHELPVLWVRVDPDLDCLRSITMRQPEAMWILQLQQDTDVISQYEAVQGLTHFPDSFKSVEALNKVMCDATVFYRVRMAAATALSASPTMGLPMLLRQFRAQYFDENQHQIRPNDFSDLREYFLQGAIAEAISRVKERDGRTPPEVFEFVLDLLKNNDNAANRYSDNYYIAGVIRSVVNLRPRGPSNWVQKILKQVLRYLNRDCVLPSFRNTISNACLQTLSDMQAFKMLSREQDQSHRFREYLSYGNYREVRITAARCLARMGLDEPTLDLLIGYARDDPDPVFASAVFDAMCSVPPNVEPSVYFKRIKSDSEENAPRLAGLWDILNSTVTAYDVRLRMAAARFWRKLFHNFAPPSLMARRRGQPLPSSNAAKRDARPQTAKPQRTQPSATPAAAGGASSWPASATTSLSDMPKLEPPTPEQPVHGSYGVSAAAPAPGASLPASVMGVGLRPPRTPKEKKPPTTKKRDIVPPVPYYPPLETAPQPGVAPGRVFVPPPPAPPTTQSASVLPVPDWLLVYPPPVVSVSSPGRPGLLRFVVRPPGHVPLVKSDAGAVADLPHLPTPVMDESAAADVQPASESVLTGDVSMEDSSRGEISLGRLSDAGAAEPIEVKSERQQQRPRPEGETMDDVSTASSGSDRDEPHMQQRDRPPFANASAEDIERTPTPVGLKAEDAAPPSSDERDRTWPVFAPSAKRPAETHSAPASSGHAPPAFQHAIKGLAPSAPAGPARVQTVHFKLYGQTKFTAILPKS